MYLSWEPSVTLAQNGDGPTGVNNYVKRQVRNVQECISFILSVPMVRSTCGEVVFFDTTDAAHRYRKIDYKLWKERKKVHPGCEAPMVPSSLDHYLSRGTHPSLRAMTFTYYYFLQNFKKRYASEGPGTLPGKLQSS